MTDEDFILSCIKYANAPAEDSDKGAWLIELVQEYNEDKESKIDQDDKKEQTKV